MDRVLVYPGAIPLETDILSTNKDAMIGIAKLAHAVLGDGPWLQGLACTQNSPAALNVLVAPGQIYSLQNIDGTAYSSLAADTTHSILKQGISLDTVTLATPAPTTAGYSVNYLVQIAYLDTDSGSTVLPYYNASNPAVAYSGPANSGTAQNTVRKGVCSIAVKTGVAATTGTQTTPAPDAGYIGAYVVTVANGATTVTSPNIVKYTNAPFLVTTLPNAVSLSQLAAGTTNIGNRAIFTANGTFTVPANVTTIWVSGCAGGGGAGGGGGTVGSSGFAGGGGGGGGGAGQSTIKQPFTVAAGNSISITIGGPGASGIGGTTAGTAGASGGAAGNTVIVNSSTSTTLLTLIGGGGGAGGNGQPSTTGGIPTGGGGGAYGTGYPAGSYGTDGNYAGNGGVGASGPFGGGGGSGRGANGPGISGAGPSGFGSGAGGGGGAYGTVAAAGGNGASGSAGIIILEW